MNMSTSTASVLSDVIAYVDVRTRSDNRSKAVAEYLSQLGASVVEKLDKHVTHVVFKDGTKSTYDRAIKFGIPLVSVTWVESCREQQAKANEKDYPSIIAEGYSTPTFLSKIRKFRSMQPRSFEDDLISSTEKVKRRLNRAKGTPKTDEEILVPETVAKASVAKRQSVGTTIFNTPTPVLTPTFDRLKLTGCYGTSPLTVSTASSITTESTSSVQDKCIANPKAIKRRLLTDNDNILNTSSLENIIKRHDVVNKIPCASGKKRQRGLSSSSIDPKEVIKPDEIGNKGTTKRRKLTELSNTCENISDNQAHSDKNKEHLCSLKAKPSHNMTSTAAHKVTSSENCNSNNRSKSHHRQNRQSLLDFKSSTKRKTKQLGVDEALSQLDSDANDDDNKINNQMGHVSKKNSTKITTTHFFKTKKQIVLTSLHRQEREIVHSAVKKLGGYVISEEVTVSTTHIVCGNPRRTLNLLGGISLGCWILSKEWVMRSIENGGWLDEADYEMSDDFPHAMMSRLRKIHRLFHDVGLLCVNGNCKPPKIKVESLLAWSGAQTTNCLRKAKINVISDETFYHAGLVNVHVNWVLDCIMQQTLLCMDGYIVPQQNAHESSPEY